MEQCRLTPLDRKQHSGNPRATEASPNLKEPIAQGTADRHADRPAEFYSPNIVTNGLAILGAQLTQPIADRLRSGIGLIEGGRQPLDPSCVPKMVQSVKVALCDVLKQTASPVRHSTFYDIEAIGRARGGSVRDSAILTI
jgi:hypothetical protein